MTIAAPPREIFKAYDIRGIYGEQMDAETAMLIGRAFARVLARLRGKATSDLRVGLGLTGTEPVDLPGGKVGPRDLLLDLLTVGSQRPSPDAKADDAEAIWVRLGGRRAGRSGDPALAPNAGRRMDFETATPGDIAQAIAEEIGREVDYRPVESDGAARAAAQLAELL